MNARKLAENLHEAECVYYDENAEIIYAWFGGHYVHLYNLDGFEIEVFSAGDWKNDSATLDEVKGSILYRVKLDEEEE